ncbi:MAG: ABC transporter permease [Candidatus Acidiferrales bacterium]
MRGILRLAYKLLVNDKSKFTALLVGITFAVFLMMFVTSMFIGVLDHSSSTVINIGASMWVMDPAVNTPANSIGMPDYILDAVRSMQGVNYAVPLYTGTALVKLPEGTYQAANVVGLDDTSLFGRPQIIEGKIEDIYAENGFVVVQDGDYQKLQSPHVGAQFEVNDNRGVIVGVAKVSVSGLFGIPTLYTTYERAIQYIPNPRYTISYVLVEPKNPSDIAGIKKQVKALGYLALTKQEFMARTSKFYMFQTGVGMNILIMTVISFIVGLSISGQTFYTFILENLERFGALKAIGTTSRELTYMILFQATFTALTGYGLGVGLCTFLIALAKWRIADYAAMITYLNLMIAFVMVVVIAGTSSYAGIRRVLRIEPFEIFRG